MSLFVEASETAEPIGAFADWSRGTLIRIVTTTPLVTWTGRTFPRSALVFASPLAMAADEFEKNRYPLSTTRRMHCFNRWLSLNLELLFHGESAFLDGDIRPLRILTRRSPGH